MDNIKFRAWNKSKKKMVYCPIIIPKRADGSYAVAGNGNNYIVMLSTGIKDRNNRDIFEGDILKEWPANGPTCRVEYWQDRGGPGGGVYSGFAFIRILDKEEYMMDSLGAGDTEILGNIYENPEFLEQNG